MKLTKKQIIIIVFIILIIFIIYKMSGKKENAGSLGNWQCIGDINSPIKRIDGDVACMSPDGRGCNWGSCTDPSKQISNPNFLKCGEMHKKLYGITGYDTPDHWCNKANKQLPQKWNYVGCFNDKEERALPNWRGDVKSVEECNKIVAAVSDDDILGLQYGGQCRSGKVAFNDYKKYGSTINCPTLGGSWTNQVYSTKLSMPPPSTLTLTPTQDKISLAPTPTIRTPTQDTITYNQATPTPIPQFSTPTQDKISSAPTPTIRTPTQDTITYNQATPTPIPQFSTPTQDKISSAPTPTIRTPTQDTIRYQETPTTGPPLIATGTGLRQMPVQQVQPNYNQEISSEMGMPKIVLKGNVLGDVIGGIRSKNASLIISDNKLILRDNNNNVLWGSSSPSSLSMAKQWNSVGCFKDDQQRTIPGEVTEVPAGYPIETCKMLARERNHDILGIQNNNLCFTNLVKDTQYTRIGKSDNCKNGRGGVLANNVYILE
jgi:hypothetical protein